MLSKMFAIKTNTGKYISESMIFQNPESEEHEWLYYLNDNPVNMCLCYKHQIEGVISRLMQKQKFVGLNFAFEPVEVIL